jgi:hypothetical protein
VFRVPAACKGIKRRRVQTKKREVCLLDCYSDEFIGKFVRIRYGHIHVVLLNVKATCRERMNKKKKRISIIRKGKKKKTVVGYAKELQYSALMCGDASLLNSWNLLADEDNEHEFGGHAGID